MEAAIVLDVIPIRIPSDPLADADDSPLVVDAARLAKLLCLGVRTIRTHDAAGKLPQPIRIGGSVRWHLEEIKRWLGAGCPDRETWEARRASRK